MSKEQRTLYCGNLSEKVTEEVLYELFLQAGPLENVTIPKDKDGKPRRYAFITFKHDVSVPYTVALMNGISLYGKTLTLDARTGAGSERNPYLEKLVQYRNSLHQNPMWNYGLNQQYDDNHRRYESRRHDSRSDLQRPDYNTWNSYPPSSSPYNVRPPGGYPSHGQNQGRFHPNSMPQSPISYPYGNRNPWSRNR